MKFKIAIYTDGSCLDNPGYGGYASLVIFENNEYIVGGGMYKQTTSQRMELTAALKSLLLLSKHQEAHLYSIIVYSDSKYLVDGINTWISGWERNGWKTANRQDVKNKDLWKKLQNIILSFSDINFKWIKGHSANQKNNKCDKIAQDMQTKAIKEKRDFMESELPNKLI